MDAEPPSTTARAFRAPGPRALWRLLRSLWLFRGQLEEHQRAWFVEVATAVKTLIDSSILGRAALVAYRWAMRGMLAASILLLLIATAILIPFHEWWGVLLAAPFLAGGAFVGWYWFVWGAMLRMLDEYADPTRTLPLSELAPRLRELAAEGKGLAGVPKDMVRDLVTVEQAVEGEPAPAGSEHGPRSAS